jgi:hypothetical protein
MIPNFEWDFMVKSLEWLWTVRAYNGYPNIKILFSFASKLIPEQAGFLRQHFNNSIQFIYSPIILDWHRKKLVDHLLDQEVILRDYLNTSKHRQFVCLNKEPRMSRMLFLHGLRTENLLDQGFISIRKSIAYSPDLVTNRSPYASKVRADMNYMLPEMRADNVEIAPGDNIDIAHTLPLDLMKHSSYEMISETTTRYELKNVTDFCTLSEKTTKILYSGRPFMINGGPHLLRLIRDLGFRTHDYLFDESYDDKLDILDRHEIIMNNIKRYRNRPNDVLEIAKQHVDVLTHNQERLRTFDQADYWVKTLVNT